VPPGLPGYNANRPDQPLIRQARQLLKTRYGGADRLPPTYTTSGNGSDIDSGGRLAQM
jgi:hypothetical protein